MPDNHSSIKWKSITGFPDYEINEFGIIRTVTYRSNIKPGQIIHTYTNRHGYVAVKLRNSDGKRIGRYLQGHVARAFHGPPPSPIHQAAHRDGNKKNNYYRNIEWLTPKENCEDRFKHGTALVGDRNHKSKLTEKEVLAIRSEGIYPQGRMIKDIADYYDIDRNTVRLIRSRKLWRHI